LIFEHRLQVGVHLILVGLYKKNSHAQCVIRVDIMYFCS
jgi:hypothetical protein